MTDEASQQGIQRLYASYNQCVARVAQADDRFEQFRAAIRHEALKVQRVSQDLQHQGQGLERIRHTLFDVVQDKVDNLEERFRIIIEHLHGITATVDRNEHAKCFSIALTINEQEDIRRLVEECASRLDHSRENVGATQSESSLAMQLEISDLKAKVLRLTEQYTGSEQVALIEQQIHRWRHVDYLICQMTTVENALSQP